MPSPWDHSRRNCLAGPSGLLVHSMVTRSLMVSSYPSAAGSTPSLFMVFKAHPIRRDASKHTKSTKGAYSIPSTSSPSTRRKMIKCTKCTQFVEESDVVMHHRIFHAQNYLSNSVLQRPPTKLLQQQHLQLQPKPVVDFLSQSLVPTRRCPDLACDFVCETEIERLVHQQAIHCDPFKGWKLTGRFNLHPDTMCPLCPHPVINICSLREHLFRMHPTRMFSQKEIYACTSCNARFGRLYQVYAHWHLGLCTGRMRILPVPPKFVPTLGGTTLQPLAKAPIAFPKGPVVAKPKT